MAHLGISFTSLMCCSLPLSLKFPSTVMKRAYKNLLECEPQEDNTRTTDTTHNKGPAFSQSLGRLHQGWGQAGHLTISSPWDVPEIPWWSCPRPPHLMDIKFLHILNTQCISSYQQALLAFCVRTSSKTKYKFTYNGCWQACIIGESKKGVVIVIQACLSL